ncbi:hypothetical protein [Cellulomonas sp. Marseille-Q8402]
MTAGGAAGGPVGGGPAARRSPVWLGRGPATTLAAGALLALAGLVTLLVLWVGLVTATLRTGLADDAGTGPGNACVAAATADEGDAEVTSSLLPPRAVCTWTTDGRSRTTVLAERPGWVATAAAVAGGVGVLTVATTVVVEVRRRRRAARASVSA